jgi:hypothetical protein
VLPRCADANPEFANAKQRFKEKMKFNSRSVNRAASLLSVLLAGTLLTACSQTSAPEPAPAAQVQAAQAPPPPMAAVQPATPAAPGGQYEEPPVINIDRPVCRRARSRDRDLSVQPQVPTNGAMGQYTIVADESVFKANAGTYYVESLDMLNIRLSEIPAIATLENLSETASVREGAGHECSSPGHGRRKHGDPSDGHGDRTARAESGIYLSVWARARDKSIRRRRVLPEVAKAAGETANATINALGYDQVRRDLARKLHVDPYTSDPILTKELNKTAWVMFSARMTVDTAMMAVPGSIIISSVEFTDDLVYQTPKADLIILVETKLKDLGLSPEDIAAFTHNSAIPLSLQVSAVKALDALGDIPGRRAAAAALANVMTEYQARFLVTSLKMLGQWSQQKSPITGIQAPGLLIGHDQNGTTIVPAPVDYLSWTQRIAGFATDPQLMAMQNRVLWITGKMTPLAQQQLTANGWSVREGALQ